MNYYYITGTSRGIGKSMAETLLKDESNYIIGMSRTQSIKHDRYEHIQLDLTDLDAVQDFQFIDIEGAKKVVLINNSGDIGDIKHVGTVDNLRIIENYRINAVSPSILMNNFVGEYQHVAIEKMIFNVSSGAARHAIESWSSYCASKSALDMFSQVIEAEQQVIKDNTPVRIYSVAPGIIDTQMQDEIRSASSEDFSELSRFVSYKEKNLLSSPNEVAEDLLRIIESPENYKDVILDVRDV